MRSLLEKIYALFRKQEVDEGFILNLMDMYKDSLDKQDKRRADRLLRKISSCLDDFEKISDRDNYNKLLIKCIHLTDAEIGTTRKRIDDLTNDFPKI